MTARKWYTFCSSLSPIYIYVLMPSVFPPRDHHVKTFQSWLLQGWGDEHYTLWNN